jgi:hypothetical protein
MDRALKRLYWIGDMIEMLMDGVVGIYQRP